MVAGCECAAVCRVPASNTVRTSVDAADNCRNDQWRGRAIFALRLPVAGEPYKNKPPGDRSPRGESWGWEFATLSFPVPTLGAQSRGLAAGSPTLFPAAWQRCRSHSRTVSTLADRNLSGEASQPGSVLTCRWALAGPGSDTPAIGVDRVTTVFRKDGLRGWRSVGLA